MNVHTLGGGLTNASTLETLGNFLEFECLVCESQTIDTAHEVLRELRHAFQQAIGEPIDRSYADLLAAEQDTPTERNFLPQIRASDPRGR